jgi:hypothetical protein
MIFGFLRMARDECLHFVNCGFAAYFQAAWIVKDKSCVAWKRDFIHDIVHSTLRVILNGSVIIINLTSSVMPMFSLSLLSHPVN